MAQAQQWLVALGAVAATFLVLVALARPLVTWFVMARRTRRFLYVKSAQALAPSAAPQSALVAHLEALVATHPTTVLLACVAVLLMVVVGLLRSWGLGILLAVITMIVAMFLEQRAVARRRAQIQEQLVPALRLMASALESGASIPIALERVARSSPEPVAGMFGEVVRAVALGSPLHAALTELAVTTKDESFEFFAMIVAVQHRVGGNLSALLMVLANNVNERIRMQTELRILTAQVRFSGWILIGLPFFVVGALALVQPAYISPLVTTDMGRVMLVLIIGLLLAAIVVIRALSEVEA